MIKRYIQFLNENIENQSVLMNETEIIEFLNSRLKFSSGRIFKDILFDDINYNHNDKLLTPILYRGIKSKEEYFKTDYTNYNRFAHNSARSRTITSKNLLNLILSNDKRFSEFQKRNKSIIGSNYKDVSSDFGNIYFLFPIEENPKFTYIKDNFDLYNITENPIDIQPAIEKILKMYNIDLNDTDYTEYLEITKEFDNKCTNPVFLEKFFNIIKNIPIRNFIRQRLENKLEAENNNLINLTNLIDLLFNIPKLLSHLENINYLDIKNITSQTELWTETPCIMIKTNSMIGNVIQDLL
jgi:hypothetical protein